MHDWNHALVAKQIQSFVRATHVTSRLDFDIFAARCESQSKYKKKSSMCLESRPAFLIDQVLLVEAGFFLLCQRGYSTK